jgi:hypothetical protein
VLEISFAEFALIPNAFQASALAIDLYVVGSATQLGSEARDVATFEQASAHVLRELQTAPSRPIPPHAPSPRDRFRENLRCFVNWSRHAAETTFEHVESEGFEGLNNPAGAYGRLQARAGYARLMVGAWNDLTSAEQDALGELGTAVRSYLFNSGWSVRRRIYADGSVGRVYTEERGAKITPTDEEIDRFASLLPLLDRGPNAATAGAYDAVNSSGEGGVASDGVAAKQSKPKSKRMGRGNGSMTARLLLLLQTPEGKSMSVAELAKQIGCSKSLVSKHRAEQNRVRRQDYKDLLGERTRTLHSSKGQRVE